MAQVCTGRECQQKPGGPGTGRMKVANQPSGISAGPEPKSRSGEDAKSNPHWKFIRLYIVCHVVIFSYPRLGLSNPGSSIGPAVGPAPEELEPTLKKRRKSSSCSIRRP